jgi:hypothetical protein
MMKSTVRMPSIMHAGAGEIHLRPILNLKQEGIISFRAIATEVAVLVKKIQRLAEWGAW